MLIEEGVTKADFHCFCGKAKLGVKIAEAGIHQHIPSLPHSLTHSSQGTIYLYRQ